MQQKTIKQEAVYQGIGLHKGQMAEIRFCPAETDSGIIFVRTDLAQKPEIPALVQFVTDTSRGTTIGKDGVQVYTVEHILAAVAGLGISNLRIEIDGIEPPAADGSCLPFVQVLQKAGILEQEAELSCITLEQPVWIKEGDKYLVALPDDNFKISFNLLYDHPAIGSQFCELDVAQDFISQAAGARTFGFLAEFEYLKSQGLALGGSLDNAIVVGEMETLNPLRCPDEFVKHKILDMVGDLSLIGFPLKAHLIASRSGHALNTRLAALIKKQLKK